MRRFIMKRLIVGVTFVTMCVLVAYFCMNHESDKAAEEETPVVSNFSWGRDFTGKYLKVDSVKQIIAVQVTEGSNADVKMFEKSEIDGKTVWTETLSCAGIIGKNGAGKEKEGDMKTPIGDFGIVKAFGIKLNPGTQVEFIDVIDDLWACSDTVAYNKIINIKEVPHDCSGGEHMIECTPEYNYGFVIDYNPECEFGKGSSIFFHCTGSKPYTAGCVAVSETDMKTILQAIDKNVRVVINYK